ncbi:peptide chain release factor N(5)-glutamine methyltransferase, partial [Staphylococcus cohnii]
MKCFELDIETTRAEWLMLDLVQGSKADYLMHKDEVMSDIHLELYNDAEVRMLKGEPIQYIVGSQSFYGETLKVTEDCLIPRPDTEEVMLHFYKEIHSDDT